MNLAISDLGNRRFDDKGNCFLRSEAVMELLYQGKSLGDYNFIVDPKDDDIIKYNRTSYKTKITNDEYVPVDIEARRNEWFYPDEYNLLNLTEFFDKLCKTDEERARAESEVQAFIEKGFEKFLRFCIYLAVVLKRNDIVHGVGRGSSCACFLLYLLGVNKVNPLEYGLQIEEFLK